MNSLATLTVLAQFAFFVLQVTFCIYGILAFRKYLGLGRDALKSEPPTGNPPASKTPANELLNHETPEDG